MPEPSASDRRKAAELGVQLSATRLVDCLEHGDDIRFKCQYCGTTKTWGRWELTTAHRDRLGLTLAEVVRVLANQSDQRSGGAAILKTFREFAWGKTASTALAACTTCGQQS